MLPRAEDLFGFENPELLDRLKEFYDEAEAALIRAKPSMEREIKYMSRLPMHILPFKDRQALISKYRDIIGLDQALLSMAERAPRESILSRMPDMDAPESMREKVAAIYGRLNTSRSPSNANAYGRLPMTEGSILSDIYSRLNLQFRSNLQLDRAGIVAEGASTAASYFTLGLDSIPARNSLQTFGFPLEEIRNKKLLVYDVETAGLARGQIREVAYSQMSDGIIETERLAFTPKEFNRGIVAVDGRAASLTEFLSNRFGLDAPASTTGDEFAQGMKPFLERILDSDYIVGHNITGFDNEQVFVGLSRTNLYRNDEGFRELVDNAFEKVRTKSVDTMHLVRQMPGIADITTAQELARRGDDKIYSISNLLLKTNLVDFLKPLGGEDIDDSGQGLRALAQLMGYDEATQTFKYGLHHASVDTAVTTAIIDAAEAGGLSLKSLGQGMIGEDLALARAMRQQIAASAAITPVTNLTEVNQLTDKVLKKLIDTYDNKGVLRASRGGELDKLLRTDKKAAFRALRTGELAPTSIRLSAIEQGILQERDIAGGISDEAIARGNLPSRVNQILRGSLRGRRDTGLPFAGLSGDERQIAFGVAEATSNLRSLRGAERQVADLASDTLVSRFNLFQTASTSFNTRSGRVSLPAQLLRDAGVLKPTDMVSLSVVEATEKTPYTAVNVVKSLDSRQRSKLRRFLIDDEVGIINDDTRLAQALGIEGESVPEQLSRFREAVKNGLLDKIDKRGVSIAQIYGGTDVGASDNIIDVFRKFFNTEGQLRDQDMGKVLFPIMDIDYDQGTLRTAGAVVDKAISKDDRQAIGRAVEGTRAAYRQYLELPEDKLTYQITRAIKSGADNAAAQKIYRAVSDKVIPNLGKGIIGISAAAVGAVLFKRHREMQTLDETLEFQGYESSQPGQYGIYEQVQERMATGEGSYARHIDPLATASLTTILNESRTGHTAMDWTRNNSIYGGLL